MWWVLLVPPLVGGIVFGKRSLEDGFQLRRARNYVWVPKRQVKLVFDYGYYDESVKD